MTAVVDLEARRQARRVAEQECCPRHALDALIARIRDHVDDTADELLVDRQHLVDVLDDVDATSRRLLTHPQRDTR